MCGFRAYDEAVECFERIYHSCSAFDRSFLDGVDDGYDWLCHDGRTGVCDGLVDQRHNTPRVTHFNSVRLTGKW